LNCRQQSLAAELSVEALLPSLLARVKNWPNDLGTNWTDEPGSFATNQMGFPINHAHGVVFFRMIYP